MKDQAFYSTAAQVIPILFLAIVFEQRIWHGKEPFMYFGVETGSAGDRLGKPIALLIVLLVGHLFVGEAFALAAISDGGGFASRYIVWGSIAFGGIIVVLPTLMLGLVGLAPAWTYEREIVWDHKLAAWLFKILAVAASVHTVACLAVAIF